MEQIHAKLGETQATLKHLESETPELEQIREQIKESAGELAMLKDQLRGFDSLAVIASYYQGTSGRTRLRRRLHKVFDAEYKPDRLHEFLADIETPMIIVTTNYDDLLEQAFNNRSPSKPYHLVVYPSDLMNIGILCCGGVPVLSNLIIAPYLILIKG